MLVPSEPTLVAQSPPSQEKKVSANLIPAPGPASFKARLAVAPKHGKHGLRGVQMPPVNGRRVLVWVFDDAMPSTGSPTGLFWGPNTSAYAMLLHEHARVAGEVTFEERPLILTVRGSRAEAEYNALITELQRRAIPDGKPSAWMLDEFDTEGKRTRGLRVSFVLILDDEASEGNAHNG